jgi:hypothetical protein
MHATTLLSTHKNPNKRQTQTQTEKEKEKERKEKGDRCSTLFTRFSTRLQICKTFPTEL